MEADSYRVRKMAAPFLVETAMSARGLILRLRHDRGGTLARRMVRQLALPAHCLPAALNGRGVDVRERTRALLSVLAVLHRACDLFGEVSQVRRWAMTPLFTEGEIPVYPLDAVDKPVNRRALERRLRATQHGIW